MNIRPIGDRILVQRVEAESTSPGGIIIPENAKEKPMRCVVQAVGRGRIDDSGKLHEPQVKAGDHVLIAKYAGSETDVEGGQLIFIREDEILGVFEE